MQTEDRKTGPPESEEGAVGRRAARAGGGPRQRGLVPVGGSSARPGDLEAVIGRRSNWLAAEVSSESSRWRSSLREDRAESLDVSILRSGCRRCSLRAALLQIRREGCPPSWPVAEHVLAPGATSRWRGCLRPRDGRGAAPSSTKTCSKALLNPLPRVIETQNPRVLRAPGPLDCRRGRARRSRARHRNPCDAEAAGEYGTCVSCSACA